MERNKYATIKPSIFIFGIWYLEFGIWCSVFDVWNLEFGIWNFAFGVWRLAFKENTRALDYLINQ